MVKSVMHSSWIIEMHIQNIGSTDMEGVISLWVRNRVSQWLRMISHFMSNISIVDRFYQVGLFMMVSKGLVFEAKRGILMVEGSEIFVCHSWCLVKYIHGGVVDCMMKRFMMDWIVEKWLRIEWLVSN